MTRGTTVALLALVTRARGLSTAAPRRWRVRFRGAEVWADDGELLRTAEVGGRKRG